METLGAFRRDRSRRIALLFFGGMALCLAFWFFGGLAFAQDVAVAVDDVVAQGQEVINLWKELGALAGLAAMAAFMVDLTKLGFIKAAIDRNKLQWIRPMLAVIVAVVGGIALGVARGVSMPLAVVEGVLAGVMAPGFHELWSVVTEAGRSKRAVT